MSIPELGTTLRFRIARFLAESPVAAACKTAPEAEALVLSTFAPATYDDFVAGLLLARDDLLRPVEVAND